MENMQLDEMEIKDVEIDNNSLYPNKKIRIAADDDDFEHPPVITNAEEIVFYLEHHQDDLRLIMEILRKTTLEFSDYHKELISKMDQEYTAWRISNETRCTAQFEDYVIDLKEDLIVQAIFDPEFCEEQRLKYAYIHKILEKSPFPYSEKEINLLEVIKHDMECATGNVTNHCDQVLLDEFQEFLDLMKTKDHINFYKFYVETTVEYYVQEIVDELYYAECDENRRNIPEHFADEPMVNLATHVKKELQSAYSGTRYESHIDLFHLGLADVYYQLIDIFKFSGLLTDHQNQLLNGTFEEIGLLENNRSSSRYEDLHLGFYGFMDALRRDHKKRETKIENGYKVTDEEGIIAKKVQKVVKSLCEVEDAEKTHHESFSEYSSPIPEITNKLFRHFRRIYPENAAEPVTVQLPNGYYTSILLYPETIPC